MGRVEYLTAVDTAFDEKSNMLFAAAVTVRFSDLIPVERAFSRRKAEFPYMPALLSFREGPIILEALARLMQIPDVIIFAGHGKAHPRSFGMASHLGMLVNIPSIGCARKKLVGEYRIPELNKGTRSPLYIFNKEAGTVYRSKANVKPIFISPGYKCSLADSFEIVRACITEYRLPEPLRQAHLLAGKMKRRITQDFLPVDKAELSVAKGRNHGEDSNSW
ncbi:Endonuclease V [Candidatus Zixiibacteriota bacterium]|nr:Endonuclease V [candidate division Zixibacteria bacterium]